MLLIIGDQRESEERVSAFFPAPCNRGTFNVLSGKDTDRWTKTGRRFSHPKQSGSQEYILVSHLVLPSGRLLCSPWVSHLHDYLSIVSRARVNQRSFLGFLALVLPKDFSSFDTLAQEAIFTSRGKFGRNCREVLKSLSRNLIPVNTMKHLSLKININIIIQWRINIADIKFYSRSSRGFTLKWNLHFSQKSLFNLLKRFALLSFSRIIYLGLSVVHAYFRLLFSSLLINV